MEETPSKEVRWVAVSGGFDPIHIGHIRMFKKARALGDKLVVIVNNDHWLQAKKGFAFMPQEERLELIGSLPYVDKVVLTDHAPGEYFVDKSVCRTLHALRPAIFANGGDRKPDGDPVPEVELCEKLGIELAYNVGEGGKVQSSSWMIGSSRKSAARKQESWGAHYDWDGGETWSLSTVQLAAGESSTLPLKRAAQAQWILLEGDAAVTAADGSLHRLEIGVPYGYAGARSPHVSSEHGALICEAAFGAFPESAGR